MKSIALAVLLATVAAGGASAQTASFQCPAGGTRFSYTGDGLEKVNTAAGQDGTVCLGQGKLSRLAHARQDDRPRFGIAEAGRQITPPTLLATRQSLDRCWRRRSA